MVKQIRLPGMWRNPSKNSVLVNGNAKAKVKNGDYLCAEDHYVFSVKNNFIHSETKLAMNALKSFSHNKFFYVISGFFVKSYSKT